MPLCTARDCPHPGDSWRRFESGDFEIPIRVCGWHKRLYEEACLPSYTLDLSRFEAEVVAKMGLLEAVTKEFELRQKYPSFTTGP